ncbi:MAG: GAF domain-containing SpoIIE family protein phosphatase [Balneolaceae bacterium]|nr:GAF domain-containing SpoIIE family protein phosphatase [Balneolaceae bacterium]
MSNPDLLSKENRKLQLAVNELSVLNDIATTISSTQPVETIIDQIVQKCIKHLKVQEGVVSLLERNSEADRFQTMIRRHDSSSAKVPIKLDDRLKGWMLKNRSTLMSNDIGSDDRFKFLEKDSYSFRSILCVPLMVKGDLTGYLAVFNKKEDQPFTDEDRRLLSIIGSQSAQVIENARLYEEEKALLTLQEELRMARDIQIKLLPDSIPDIPGFQIAATNIPAKSVGGDYYDFIPLDSGKTGLCIGDITGKGMPAAMLMANLQATLRSQAMIHETCADCLEGTNKLLYKSTESTKFATLFYGEIDPENGTLNYANGGHDAPLLFRKGEDAAPLNATGLLVGVMADSAYGENTITFRQDDLLLLYSDGITEAMNTREEEFGLDRLKEVTSDLMDRSADGVMDAILEAVDDHTEDHPQSDDITLLVIKRV